MFFFITWGTSTREDVLGVVADYCPYCRRVRRHAVIEYARTSHVYFIPLGSGTPVAAGRECYRCKQIWNCHPRRYDSILDERIALSLSMDRLLEVTNTRLLMELEELGYSEPESRPPPLPAITDSGAQPRKEQGPEPDPQVVKAMERLDAHVDFDRKAAQLKNAYRIWHRMSVEEQINHSQAVGRYLDEQQHLAELDQLASDMVESAPKRRATAAAAVFAAALSVLGIWLLRDAFSDAILVTLAIGSVVAAYLVYYLLSDYRDRRWVRDHLIPELERAGYNLHSIQEHLDRLKINGRPSSESLNRLIGWNSTLAVVLGSRSRHGPSR